MIVYIGLALTVALAAFLNYKFPGAFDPAAWLKALWQVFACNGSHAGAAGVLLAAAPLALPGDPAAEFQGLLDEMKAGWAEVKGLPEGFKSLRAEAQDMKQHLQEVRRGAASRSAAGAARRSPGGVSDDCARHMAATFITHCERSGKLEALCSAAPQRDALVQFARGTLDLTTRTALTTSDIGLPTQFGGEIRELISEFGVVRQRMSPYPIGMGTSRPARMGTRPSFGAIAMSAAFTEKSPTVSFATLESHKLGGIVRLPREIDEQSVLPMGQFLARYGAVEFARAEDTWGFLADGSPTYDGVRGVVPYCVENSYAHVLAAGKTKPSDATLEDFRSMRRVVNKAALNGRLSAYYLDTTWETRLAAFRTAQEPNIYQRLPDGSALLDGYPVVWTNVLEPYGTAATADTALAVFGALSFWWFGEHGHPRIDTSEHVWFANDQLAVRFIEEIDIDFAAADAVSVLATAAS